MATLPKASTGVTGMLKAVRATAVGGAPSTKWTALAARTFTGLRGPGACTTGSPAVPVWLPAVSRPAPDVPQLARKERTPLGRVLLPGRTAAPSVLVKWTVPV